MLPALKEQISDVVYSVRLKNKDKANLCVVCEHQSTADKWMIMRAAEYTLGVGRLYISQKKDIPLIHVTVLYNGNKAYNYPTSWKEVIHADPELVDRYFLRGYQLLDLNKIPDVLSEKFFLSDMVKFVLKSRRHPVSEEEEKQFFEKLRVYFTKIRDRDLMLGYLFYLSEVKDYAPEQLISLVGKENEEVVMTLGERWHKEGWNKGWSEGVVSGKHAGGLDAARIIAERLLLKKMTLDDVVETTGLTRDKVRKLQKDLAKVTT